MGIKLHPRYFIVAKAANDYQAMLFEFMSAHPDLTYVELLTILLPGIERLVVKYMLREERHPGEDDKRADEE
jgi:hypothetical protein